MSQDVLVLLISLVVLLAAFACAGILFLAVFLAVRLALKKDKR